ncbi:MAG TPA: UDP-2,3-diacylglucosamine diphosphatase [Planctomycetaceae bacterium]|jgi:UDP-2,3-diacylglucosamine pyrophosphatase LpxH
MQRIRSIFISDVHLGCRYTHADSLLAFLKNHQPQYLYIVGDFVDGWRLRKSWYWNDTYTFLFKRIVDLMKRGTRVFYTPGNHDEFLRDFIENLGSVQLADEFIHVTADRRKLLVMHGDKFDACVVHAKWLSHLGDAGYNILLGTNNVFNAVRRRLGFGYWSLSQAVKQRVKQATCYIGNFEEFVTRYAAERGCAGVICGHIHTPKILDLNGLIYYNTGDWVESCTALVEYADGTLELLYRALNAAGSDAADDLETSSPCVSAAGRRLPFISVFSPGSGQDESPYVDAPNAG